jgi:hypothetical protein
LHAQAGIWTAIQKRRHSIPEIWDVRDHWLSLIRFGRDRPAACAEADSFVQCRCCPLDLDQGGNARATGSRFEVPGLNDQGVLLAFSTSLLGRSPGRGARRSLDAQTDAKENSSRPIPRGATRTCAGRFDYRQTCTRGRTQR